jgi:hypothetical protein
VALSTSGPAGLQSSRLPCEASDIELFVLVPRASDHLFNLETQAEVTVVNEIWNMKGQAHVVARTEYPANLTLTRSPEASWSEVVQIHPIRVSILQPETGTPSETIDVN